jgi:hypothetical protein
VRHLGGHGEDQQDGQQCAHCLGLCHGYFGNCVCVCVCFSFERLRRAGVAVMEL